MKDFEQLFENGRLQFTAPAGSGWSLSAAGDYWLDDRVAAAIRSHGVNYLSDSIKALCQADISIVNLEMALRHDADAPRLGVATGDIKLFEQLHQAAPFSVYALANNHILDAGNEQFVKSLGYFQRNNIAYVGAGEDVAHAGKPLFLTQGGVKVGILAFAQDENQLATADTPGVIELSEKTVIPAVRDLVKRCDVPVVILHDGFEFIDFPRAEFRELCHKIAALGVKVIIGHHSHVPQGIEYIDNCLIFYSLGNFLFNIAYHNTYPWTRKSFVPVITFAGKEIAAVELRGLVIELAPYRVRPANATESREIFEHLRQITAIVRDERRLRHELDRFYTETLLPEFFKFIREYGDKHRGDYSELIEQYKHCAPIRHVFAGFVELYYQS